MVLRLFKNSFSPSVCDYMYVYTCICICVYICSYTHTYINLCMYSFMWYHREDFIESLDNSKRLWIRIYILYKWHSSTFSFFFADKINERIFSTLPTQQFHFIYVIAVDLRPWCFSWPCIFRFLVSQCP